MKPHSEIEPFFITEETEAGLIAAGYEFALLGWQLGEMLSETVSRHLKKAGTASGCEPRDEGL